MAGSTTANWWQYSRWLYAAGRNLRTMLLDAPNIAGNANEVLMQGYVDALVRFNAFFYDTAAHATGTIALNPFGNVTGDAVTVGALTVTEGVEWVPSVDVTTSAFNLAAALSSSVEVYASATDNVVTITAVAGGVGGNSLGLTTTDVDGGLLLSASTLLGGSAASSGSRPWLADWYYKKNASTQDLAWSLWPVSNLLEFEKVIARDVKKVPITDVEASEADILFAALGNRRLGTGSIFGQVSGSQ